MADRVLRTIYVDLEQIEKIKKLSKKTKVPQAKYIREAVDLLLRKYKNKLK